MWLKNAVLCDGVCKQWNMAISCSNLTMLAGTLGMQIDVWWNGHTVTAVVGQLLLAGYQLSATTIKNNMAPFICTTEGGAMQNPKWGPAVLWAWGVGCVYRMGLGIGFVIEWVEKTCGLCKGWKMGSDTTCTEELSELVGPGCEIKHVWDKLGGGFAIGWVEKTLSKGWKIGSGARFSLQ
jgi:hypothetical protein